MSRLQPTHAKVPVMPAVNVLVEGGRVQGGLWRVGLAISAAGGTSGLSADVWEIEILTLAGQCIVKAGY